MDKQHPAPTAADQSEADKLSSSLLYGEVFYPGVRLLLDQFHLNAGNATTMYDLGMGCGRLLMQVRLLSECICTNLKINTVSYAVALGPISDVFSYFSLLYLFLV